MKITPCTLLATALLATTGMAQNLLTNPGFETGNLTGWSFFPPAPFQTASVELVNPPEIDPLPPGAYVGKIFGDFVPGFSVTGMFQSLSASPGDSYTMDCWSRHYSGDPLTGGGAASTPQGNFCLMKIAFFSGGTEIGGVEQTILDGNFPQNTWIDNPPITGIAPAGTDEVQALILFLQPNVDAGALQVDDVSLTLDTGAAGTYPGTGDDLRLSTALGGASLTFGAANDVKLVPVTGDSLEVNVSSPTGTYNMEPYALFAQVFGTGVPPTPLIPNLYFDASAFILQNGIAEVILGQPFGPFIGPSSGSSTYYQLPNVGAPGFSIMIQAVVVPITAPTTNGVYAATDGHELRYN